MISGDKVKHGGLWTVLFAVISLAWVFPIVLVLINSFAQCVLHSDGQGVRRA